ncbi:MAG: enoyl-CoA hydratase/isomerase family protein [Candidatus Aminicenantes bacterium]|nr:enoyl-CoA hydratase/isomerase family protein [Candidatus Aminicenantes bacterium]
MSLKTFETLQVERDGRVTRLWLNRPAVRNAFNAVMVRELRKALEDVRRDDEVRVVVLSGRGSSFCSGADLNWMREIISFTYEQNLGETMELAEALHELYSLPKPTVARVNGPAIGGGTGFVSACDIVVASTEARFGLSEVKIGVVPAAISPYVVRRMGESRARQYFLTGERMDGRRALEVGLANIVAEPAGLDAAVEAVVGSLLSSGPEALASAKELLRRVPGMDFGEAKRFTAEMIARLRVSEEAQEGMAAFLEKRKPKWAG